jgi:antitoxin CcdA
MPTKVRTNVSVDAELLNQARELRINVSAALDRSLRQEVTALRHRRWLEENRGALADANAFLTSHGLWSDGKRQF